MKTRILFLICLALLGLETPARADEALRETQTKLRALGLYQGEVDGAFGSMTAAAIRRYQVQEKLKVTGELNQQTLEHLGIEEDLKRPLPQYIALAESFEEGSLRSADPAEQMALLRQVQTALREAGIFRRNADGKPSKETRNAIRKWQRSVGQEPSGVVTEALLVDLNLRNSPLPETATSPTPQTRNR